MKRGKQMNIGQWVHFSINDVIGSFRWIYRNRPRSIFDEPMLSVLKKWNEMFRLNCDLYVYEETEGFSLMQLQACYWQELSENRWLRLAWQKRKSGKPEGRVNEEIQSLKRIYDLVINRAGKAVWADSVRLHCYMAEDPLIEAMEKFGMYTFLTDLEGQNCGLSESESEGLCHKGFWQKKKYEYIITDVCLDVIKDGIEIEELVNLAKEAILRQRQKLVLEVFCHEWAFKDIYEKAEQFWMQMNDEYLPHFGQCIAGKKTAFFPEAACAVRDKIYFTAGGDSRLFCLDIDGNEPSVFCRLPGLQRNWRNYRSIQYYKQKLVLFPYSETNILIVDLRTKVVTTIALPWDKNVNVLGKYMRAVRKGSKAWMVTACPPIKIIEFDMESWNLSVYEQWPDGVSFHSEKHERQFFSAYVDETSLYLIKGSCNKNVRMDLKTHQITVWEQEDVQPFAIIGKKRIYTVPFFGNTKAVFSIIDRESGKMLKREYIKADTRGPGIRWFHSLETENLIWYAPYNESSLLRIDKKTNSLRKISIIPQMFEAVKYTEHRYKGYEIIDAGKFLILIPEMSNCLVYIDKQSEEIWFKELYLPYEEKAKEHLFRKMQDGVITGENCVQKLSCFIAGVNWIGNEVEDRMIESKTNGERIVEAVL